MHGRGSYTWVNGNSFEGTYERNKKTGAGVWKSFDGDRYEGQFGDDKKNGRGKFIFADGSVYDGEMANDKREGRGVYNAANQDTYSGEWAGDTMSGSGNYSGAVKYNGHYEGNLQAADVGKGKSWTAPNGEKVTGVWDNVMGVGRGVWVLPSGEQYYGGSSTGQIAVAAPVVAAATPVLFESELVKYLQMAIAALDALVDKASSNRKVAAQLNEMLGTLSKAATTLLV